MARVLLPEPLGPTSAIREPAGRTTSTPRSTSGASSACPRAAVERGQRARRPRTSRPGAPVGTTPACTGSVTGTAASKIDSTRSAATRTRGTCWAAGASPATSSNNAIGVSTTTARATPSRRPSRTAGTASTRLPSTARPAAKDARALPSPLANAARASARRSSASASRTAARASACRPNATTSGSASSRSRTRVAKAERSGAIDRSAFPATPMDAQGASRAATRTRSTSSMAAPGRSQATSPMVPTETTRAIAYGSRIRNHRSCSESMSATSRVSRSPERNAGSPAGASRSRDSKTRTRRSVSHRKAASCAATRSAYRRTPLATPKNRTATMATSRKRTGGCSVGSRLPQPDEPGAGDHDAARRLRPLRSGQS